MYSEQIMISWSAKRKHLYLQHGPIDLIVEANGDGDQTRLAYQQAIDAFDGLLTGLVKELPFLRKPVGKNSHKPLGTVAKRMYDACGHHAQHHYITPMAAVAGAVADYILEAMLIGRKLTRAYVNNGGDIALHLDETGSLKVALCNNLQQPELAATIELNNEMQVGGIATSGWHGRSFSLGIADSVTVLARSSADADAAATLIANAINLPDALCIKRLPAEQLLPDSDLGSQLVTVDVEPLMENEIKTALRRGLKCASKMIAADHIIGVYASLQGKTFSLGNLLESQTKQQ